MLSRPTAQKYVVVVVRGKGRGGGRGKGSGSPRDRSMTPNCRHLLFTVASTTTTEKGF